MTNVGLQDSTTGKNELLPVTDL